MLFQMVIFDDLYVDPSILILLLMIMEVILNLFMTLQEENKVEANYSVKAVTGTLIFRSDTTKI